MPPSAVIAELRSSIARIEGVATRHAALPFGIDAIDGHVPGGGIAMGALHEVAGSAELADDAAATVFIAGILARTDGTVFWIMRWRDLFAPSLDLAGLHSDRVVFVEAGSDTNVLIAMEECLRHSGLGGVVGEIGRMTLTASRRLQLAAEQSGVPAFTLRRASRAEAMPEGSAALTRWRVRAAPSGALGMPSLGRPRWEVTLERARGGEAATWIVDGCDAEGRLAALAEFAGVGRAEAQRAA